VPPTCPLPPADPEFGSGVYVITTFRALRHMGSVECVTVQLPRRKERGGGCSVGVPGEGGLGEDAVGERRVMWAGLVVVGDSSDSVVGKVVVGVGAAW